MRRMTEEGHGIVFISHKIHEDTRGHERDQTAGSSIPAPLLTMLPYVMTILLLLFISMGRGRNVVWGTTAALGAAFDREERD